MNPTDLQQQAAARRLLQQGRLQEAEPLLEQQCRQHPGNINLLFDLASLKGARGAHGEMIRLLKKVLKRQAQFPEAHFNLGIAYSASGDISKAIQAYKTAIKQHKTYAEAHNNLGNLLLDQEELQGAVRHFQAAMRSNPKHPRAPYNLARAEMALGHHQQAIEHLQQSLNLDPHYVDAHINLGNACKALERHQDALEHYQRALALDGGNEKALFNRGVTLQAIGDFDAALDAYASVLAGNPHSADAHWNTALTLLETGDYARAWPHYAWRSRLSPPLGAHQHPRSPEWTGPLESLSAKKLLVISEQGLGDSLHFLRYVPLLRRQGLQVQVAAQACLHGLIQASGIDPNPITPAETKAMDDWPWVALLSLPGLLGVSPQQPLVTDPYLKASAERCDHWHDQLQGTGIGEPTPLIGLHWQGNPDAERGPLKGRSFPLEALAPLIDATDARFVSLQKGAGSEQLKHCSFRERFVACQETVDAAWDFDDCAAVIGQCNLIISNDSAAAHLGGGLGRPTWVLLHHTPEWRWGLKNNTSFWYRSLRLFRQQEANGWEAVMETVARDLRRRAPEQQQEPAGT